MKRRELITALGVAAVLVAIISGFAWVKWGGADKAGDMNPQRRFMEPTFAEAEFARMQRNVSRFLADLARQHQMRGDVGTALLLALESLPGVPESELRLDGAWRALREQHILI